MHLEFPSVSKLLTTLALAFAASAAVAQSPCFQSPFGTALGTGDDTVLATTPIGFAFPFGGATYTEFTATTNGLIYLSNAGVPAPGGSGCCSGSSATLISGGPTIAPFWTDLNVVSGTGMVYANTSATSCSITWNNAVEYGQSTLFDMQVVLDPSGMIKFSYSPSLTLTTHTALTGMSPGNGATLPTASDWSLGGTTASDTGFELYVGGTTPFDMAGTSLFLTPTFPGYAFVGMPIPATGCASTAKIGTGCVDISTSFYEDFATTAVMDLSNTAFKLMNTGAGYFAIPSTTAFVAPTAAAINLGLYDDDEVTVLLGSAFPYPGGSTMSLNVCSNGYVSAASNAAAYDYTPTPTEFLNWPNATWAVWHDMIPNSTGADNVYAEQIGNIVYITWLNVIGYNGTSAGTVPSTFQFQFDMVTGNVDYVFGSMDTISVSTWGGEAYIVGWTPAGASVDPGSIDLTTALPSTINLPTVVALALDATAPPLLGASVPLVSSNVPPTAPFGAVGFGFTNPNLDLTFYGMPGCFQYSDNLATVLYLPFGSTSATVNFGVPNNAAFIGVSVLAQSFAYAPGAGLTPLGAISSNGVSVNIGL